MNVIKFVYNSTTHGNYVISQVEMEPVLNPSTNEVEFKLIRHSFAYSTGRYNLRMKSRYTKDECFDTRIEAVDYANIKISQYRDKMICKLKKEEDDIKARISKLINNPIKMRYINFVKS